MALRRHLYFRTLKRMTLTLNYADRLPHPRPLSTLGEGSRVFPSLASGRRARDEAGRAFTDINALNTAPVLEFFFRVNIRKVHLHPPLRRFEWRESGLRVQPVRIGSRQDPATLSL